MLLYATKYNLDNHQRQTVEGKLILRLYQKIARIYKKCSVAWVKNISFYSNKKEINENIFDNIMWSEMKNNFLRFQM